VSSMDLPVFAVIAVRRRAATSYVHVWHPQPPATLAVVRARVVASRSCSGVRPHAPALHLHSQLSPRLLSPCHRPFLLVTSTHVYGCRSATSGKATIACRSAASCRRSLCGRSERSCSSRSRCIRMYVPHTVVCCHTPHLPILSSFNPFPFESLTSCVPSATLALPCLPARVIARCRLETDSKPRGEERGDGSARHHAQQGSSRRCGAVLPSPLTRVCVRCRAASSLSWTCSRRSSASCRHTSPHT
jgi:hypothetical protein